MRLRLLIVPDKFKGTLAAPAAAAAMAAGWKKARPGDQVDILPMSDGGDGFGSILGKLTHAKPQHTRTRDAAHRPLRGTWWKDSAGKTAIIDSAGIIGLAMLPAKKFHPFQLDSFGLGQVMLAAAKAGVARVIIGVGGSATNDGGFGMARAVGWKFFDGNRDELTEWWHLHELHHIRPPASPWRWQTTVAVDVANPLLGVQGCSRIYGPQKGLRPQDFTLAEKCLGRLASVLKAQHGINCAKLPGAGAAGGLGFGLMAFANATMEPGFEIFARHAKLNEHIQKADVVITGEGKMDHQTYMGKGVGQVALHCRKWGVPCLALAGVVQEPERARKLFSQTLALTDITDLARAQSQTGRHLTAAARQMAKSFKFPPAKTSR